MDEPVVSFIPPDGHYQDLLSYRKALIIYQMSRSALVMRAVSGIFLPPLLGGGENALFPSFSTL